MPTSSTIVATVAAARGHDKRSDGSQLWAAVRVLTDAQRQQIEHVLARFRALDGDAIGSDNQASNDNDAYADGRLILRLPDPDDLTAAPHVWTPLSFTQTLLTHVRELAHEQSGVDVAASDTVAAPRDEGHAMTKGGPVTTSPFSLEQEDFPSLGRASSSSTASTGASTTPLVSRPAAKPSKRRITTTLIATDAPYAAVAVKPPSTTTSLVPESSADKKNDNAWSRRTLLERRMATAHSTLSAMPSPAKPSIERRAALLMGDESPPLPPPPVKSALKPEVLNDTPSNLWASPPPTVNKGEHKPPSLTLLGKPKKPKRVPFTVSPSDLVSTKETSAAESIGLAAMPSAPVTANVQAARLYGHLIVQRLVPNVCSEIRFLTSLLYRPTCSSSAVSASAKCKWANEFCQSSAAATFAAVAIETMEPTLALLGADMVQLIVKTLEDVKLCEHLVARLRNAMEVREERRVEESAKTGCELPVETKGVAFRDYALPFCEDMDSRLNYRTPTESVIYSNREKIRDAFLAQLRTFQKKQNSLLSTESAPAGTSSATQDTQQLLQDVMAENLWWFARFFVLELVQVGSNPLGETDKDLVSKIMEDKMVVKNPDRLRKLHRRFSSQKGVDPTTGGTTTTGFQNTRAKTNNQQSARQGGGGTKMDKTRMNGSSGNNVLSTDSKPAATSDFNAKSRSIDQMRGFFSDNQAFFYHFLVSCDSYQFAELVKHQLEAQFLSIWRAKSKADPRKDFTEVVLRLKVLAKFIGFLRFSPQWHWSALTSALSSKNPALEAAQREAVTTLEQSQSANAFDVVRLLEESIISNTVARCIPWLCDYLSMLSSDELSTSTRYIQRALLLMTYVHRSRLLDSLGETGLFVAMQIERLFQLLAVDELLPQNMRWHSIKEKAPSWMQDATLQALRHKKGADLSDLLDGLPFLYSNMFVQVCISELDDLRGFIQTRSNPQQRSVAATRRGQLSGAKTPSLRKVRPLQVISENQLESSSTTAQVGTDADRAAMDINQRSEADNDPLRDAFFKLYPQLKRAVEFVVDMVVTNVCEHAVNKYVKPNADALIDSCVQDAKAHAPSFTQLILHGFQVSLDERLEDFMTTTVSTALREASSLCVDRVQAALRPLIAPSVPPQLVSAATTIGQTQAKAALATLITRSLRTEFLKRVAMRKRAIVKEAGGIAVADERSGDASSGSDDLARKDSIARALKFSFDDSADASNTPLEEALHTIKTNIIAMDGTLQTIARAGEQRVITRSVTSFMRFERAFRSALDDAIMEFEECDARVVREASILLWSWIWRGVRLCLKMFTVLVDGVAAATAESKPSLEAALLEGFIADFVKTLAVIAKLRPEVSHGAVAPVSTICRFVAQAAVDVPTAMGEIQRHEPTSHNLAALIDACATLYAEVLALSPAVSLEVKERYPGNWIASTIVAKVSSNP